MNVIQKFPLIFSVDDVLTDAYCDELIAQSESQTYEKALITIGKEQYRANPNVRNNDRIIFENQALADSLFSLVCPYLPDTWDERLWEIVGLNERFRYYRYSNGQRFKAHFDGYFERNKFEKSFLTLLFYLNDDFTGGETTFLEYRGLDMDNLQPRFTIKPQKGQMLVFDHNQLHEGSEVTSGTKYVLRTDVMYRAVVL